MARLSKEERGRRIKLVGKLTGVKYKNPSKVYGKRFSELNRIYLKAKKFEDSNYEFAPFRKDGHAAIQKKALVRKLFPQSIPKRVNGVWVPRRLAGPKPRLEFDFEKKTFSVGAKGVPKTEFVPVERDDFVSELTDETGRDTRLDKLLRKFPKDAILSPISLNGAALDRYGYSGDKKQVKAIITDWINTYGWAQTPGKDNSNHDMSNWFAGFRVLDAGGDEEDAE